MGQSVFFSPFFFAGHAYAKWHEDYPADGFSRPYQVAISMGMLLYAILALYCLRRALLLLFKDRVVGLGLLGILLGSNYLNYSAIDGAMTHNTLFLVYSLLLWLTIQFHKKASWGGALGIGALIGLAALTRPTEIVAFLIPMLWGVRIWIGQDIIDRRQHVVRHWKYYAAAALVCIAIGSAQLIYWKVVSGDWIVYSYGDQGFDWLSPHFINGLFSYKAGWLIYSPLMVFALIGFVPLFKSHKMEFSATLGFCLVFMYIAFAWSEWWYGGSLGQRALIQGYPLLAIPLCAFIVMARKWGFWTYVLLGLAVFFCYANIWYVHQAHRGGLLPVSQVTKSYFWKTFLTYEKVPEHAKLLDEVDRLLDAPVKDSVLIMSGPDSALVLDGEHQFSPMFHVGSQQELVPFDWIRAEAQFSIGSKEWNIWLMTHFALRVMNGDEVVKDQRYRVQRLLPVDNYSDRLSLEVKVPRRKKYTHIDLSFWNGGGTKPITISDVKVWGLQLED